MKNIAIFVQKLYICIKKESLMAQATVSARIDSKDKESFDRFCSNVGLSTSAAIYMFVKNVINERRIPFEVREPSVRYNANDIEALKKGIEQLNAGKGIVHELSDLETIEKG